MSFALSNALELLGRTPSALVSLLTDLPAPLIHATEGPETFSPFDVVGHLIDGEETDWLPRARLIRAQGPHLRFEPYDRFRHRGRNVGRTLPSLLDEFGQLRRANLAELSGWELGPRELALQATHPSLGTVTLEQLLSAWVVHDLGHLAQVSRVLAKQYRQAVGPWVAYLPILTDRETPRS